MTLTRSFPGSSRDMSTKFKSGLTGTPARQETRPSSPRPQANGTGQIGDAPDSMERGEANNQGSGSSSPRNSSSATATDNRDTQQTAQEQQHQPPAKQEMAHKKSWGFKPEIPRSDSRGRILSFDEGGVRVEEGADGRIHVIHPPAS